MNVAREQRLSRRRFLTSTSALGAASILGVSKTFAAEPRPETTRVRVLKVPAICLAPQYIAEELLRLEGLPEVEYVSVEKDPDADHLVSHLVDTPQLIS